MHPARAFKHALTARNVAARYKAASESREAEEFPTQDALNKYLSEHPDADKSKHTVKKPGSNTQKDEYDRQDADFRKKLQDIAKKNNMNPQEMVDALGKKLKVKVPGAEEREKEDADKRKKDPGHDTDQKLNELGRSLGLSREEMAEELRKKWKLG